VDGEIDLITCSRASRAPAPPTFRARPERDIRVTPPRMATGSGLPSYLGSTGSASCQRGVMMRGRSGAAGPGAIRQGLVGRGRTGWT